MALWRLIRVNAAHTHEVSRIMCNFPSGPSNNISAQTFARYSDANALCSAVESSDIVDDVGPSGFLYTRDPGSTWDILSDVGFTNYLDSNYIEVGERFYIDRWDANHPYIEVSARNATNTTLQYKCADGTLYASVIINYANFVSAISMGCFPWCLDTNSENWTSNNDARLVSITLSYYITGNPSGCGCTLSSISTSGYLVGQKFWGNVQPLDGDNPYLDGGTTEEGGGDSDKQNWDNLSDAITPDALPTKGALNSGMLKVFAPTEIQVGELTDLLFSFNFFDWLQKNLQNLEELFVSFGVVPFTVTKGSTYSVTFLGFDISTFTHPVYLTEAAQQYYEFDMGSIALNGTDGRIHASDSVFDYSPFSRLGIYLPFIGFQELDIDECRGNTINLKYRIDIVSGSVVALIYLNSDREHCIYQFSGNCLSQIPLGSVDMSGIIAGSINIATAAASAGASAAVASAGDALTAENLANPKSHLTATGADLQNKQHAAQVSNSAGTLASATANGIMGMKPNFKHSGAIGSTGGLMAVKQPYLFLTTPREAVPERYQKYCGLPCNITGKLGNFQGYTVVEDIRLNGLVATSAEVEEIYNLLKSGVII